MISVIMLHFLGIFNNKLYFCQTKFNYLGDSDEKFKADK
jgi:hypothetical protein